MPRQGCFSAGGASKSGWRNTRAFFRRRTRRFLAGSLSRNKSSESQMSQESNFKKLCGKSSEIRSLRYKFAPEKDDDANRDGEQEPRRPVHLGGPRRKSSGFDCIVKQSCSKIKNSRHSNTERRGQLRFPSTLSCYNFIRQIPTCSATPYYVLGPMLSPRRHPIFTSLWTDIRQRRRFKHVRRHQ